MTKLEKTYRDMLEKGDLQEIFPGFKGIWEKDKTLFKDMMDANISAIMEIDETYEDF